MQLSICKTLKRVLFGQRNHKTGVEAKLTYHNGQAPTTFQFSKVLTDTNLLHAGVGYFD